MSKHIEIPLEWANKAISIAKNQQYLPNSPGEITRDGDIFMCAAACIAYAGLDFIDRQKAEEFKKEISKNLSKQTVRNAYSFLGLSEKSCDETMLINDQYSSDKRIEILIQMLRC